MHRPALLRDGNFTPRARTPWGGTKLHALKQNSDFGLDTPVVIGESWELSVEPSFPSHLASGPSLEAMIAQNPEAWLGAAASRYGGCPLLVKLLDAAAPLSLQIHPSDDYVELDGGESGKPEAWYIHEAEQGAGLYLGFLEGVGPEDVRRVISQRGDLSELLFFVPVTKGDYFQIDAGTPHAIGPGITLVEPQRVLPGRRGVTYRYWDWNRLYDEAGKETDVGNPRDLHLEHALRVTRWDAPREHALLDEIRVRTGLPARLDAAKYEDISGEHPFLFAGRVAGTGVVELPDVPVLRGLTVLDGQVEVDMGPGENLVIPPGRSAALPAASKALSINLQQAHAIVSGAR